MQAYCTICGGSFSDLEDHIDGYHASRNSPITLVEFKIHADRFGNEMIMETAEEYLTGAELNELAAYLKGSRFSGTTADRNYRRNLPAKRRAYIRG